MPVVVVATIHPEPEHRDAVREAFLAVIPKVHAENGCELYAFHEDAERFYVVEQWTTREDLDAHSRGPAIAELNGAIGGLVSAPPTLVLAQPLPAGDPVKGALVR